MQKYRFELTYLDTYTGDSESVFVTDPRNFRDSFSSRLFRDLEYHGVFFQLSSDNITLDFAGEGRQIFVDRKEADGFDALITIKIERRPSEYEPYQTVYTGRAIMEEVTFDRSYANVTFQEFNALININNNKSLEVSALDYEDLFGESVTPPTQTDISLRGRQIRAIWGLRSETDSILFQSNTISGTDFSVINPNELDAQGAEIEYESGAKGFRSTQLSQGLDSGNPNRYILGGQLLIQTGGYYTTAEFDISGDYTITESGVTSGGMELFLVEIEVDPDGVDATTYTYTSIQSLSTGDPDGSYSLNKIISVVRGKNIYVALAADSSASGGVQFDVDFTLPVCTLTAETVYPETDGTGYKFFDTLKHNLQVITGEDDILESTYLNGGTLDLLYESNGWQIRGFDNPLLSSFESRMRSLKSAFNLGYGLEETYTGEDQVRIEPMSYFYQDVELISFSEVEGSTYREAPSENFIFNKIQLGFSKDSTGEKVPGTTEDVHTQCQIKSPVNQLQETYTWISDYVGSDIAIEIARRNDSRRKPNESTDYDDDNFFLDCEDVSGIRLAYNPDKDLQSEGITNFATSSNGRLNLRYAMYNHGITTNTPNEGKSSNEVQKVSKYINAKGLSKSIGYETGAADTTLGDPNKYYIPSDVPFLDSDTQIGEFTTLLKPTEYTFRVGLSFDQLQLILDAHKNKAASANYGYISFTNPRDEVKSGWLVSMIYNELDKIAEFTLIERFI